MLLGFLLVDGLSCLEDGGLTSIGQASLPETCPVCAHTPLSSDLCKPNKALRTTLKAFLRTEEKKRERDRPTASATPAPVTPVDGIPAQPETPANVDASEGGVANDSAEPGPGPNELTEPFPETTKPADAPTQDVAETNLSTAADAPVQVSVAFSHHRHHGVF